MNKSTKAAVLVLLAALLMLPLGSCKKAEEVPREIQFTFEIVDHVTGAGRMMSKNGPANSGMTITTAETEISGVVSGYISVQDLSTGKILGSGSNGSASFSTGSSTNYRVIRFHDGPELKALYDEIIRKSTGKLHMERDSTWGRKDDLGATGNESVWTEVFAQVNNVLQNPFKLGSANTGGNQNWYGFKYEASGGKDLSQSWIYVNSRDLSEEAQKAVALGEEYPEYAGEFNNLFDKPTVMTFCKYQSADLNDKGIAGFRFVYAMATNK